MARKNKSLAGFNDVANTNVNDNVNKESDVLDDILASGRTR